MGLRILEFNAFARMRGNRASHVRAETCWEFFRALLIFRFSRQMSAWKRRAGSVALPPRPSMVGRGISIQ
jgi:hypothetical protein